MDFQSKKRRDLLALLLSISVTTCSAPQDDHATVTPDPPNVVAADPANATVQAQCEWESGFRISEDSIGPLASADPIGVVRELCPQTRYWISDQHLPEVGNGKPGIVIPTSEGELYGVQIYLDEVLDESQRVNLWMVTGDGTLPGGMSMKSTLGDLTRAYGSGSASAEPEWNGFPGYVAALFERHPGLTFYLENVDMSALLPDPDAGWDIGVLLSSVSDSATILRVYVRPPGCTVGFRDCPKDTER